MIYEDINLESNVKYFETTEKQLSEKLKQHEQTLDSNGLNSQEFKKKIKEIKDMPFTQDKIDATKNLKQQIDEAVKKKAEAQKKKQKN